MSLSDSPLRPAARSASPRLAVLRRLWPFLAPYKSVLIGAMAALSVAGLTVLSIPKGLQYVVDKGFVGSDPAMLDRTLFFMLFVTVILALATYARYSLVTWLGERVIADLRRAIFGHILTLSPAFFESARSGDILSRLSADSSLLQGMTSSLSMALRNCVLLVGGIVMMLLTSAKLTLFVVVGIPVVVTPIIFFGRRVRRLSKANQDRHGDVNSAAEETIHGIRIVQAFGHEAISRSTFNSEIERAMSAAVQHIRTRAILVTLVIFLVFAAIVVVLWAGGHDVLDHRITPGQLSAFVAFAFLTAMTTATLSEVMGDVNRASGAAERIFELLDVMPSIETPDHPLDLPAPRGELQIDHLTFNYEAKPDSAALSDITFAIKPGERVAVVGPSGAGKTTLFQMILRFYDPQTGSVRLDGVDIRQARPADVRARLAIVPQDAAIFSTSARDNIAYGRPHASLDEIMDAAKAAHAHEFISALPEGYDTYLGEKGVRISGGQKQRIAIARAILRNPSVLLLDEATSALDAESERLVQDALDRLMLGRTTLIIAHRLATVIDADRILVMDHGRIVATGTHQSLVAEGGLYARLASLQFDGGEKSLAGGSRETI